MPAVGDALLIRRRTARQDVIQEDDGGTCQNLLIRGMGNRGDSAQTVERVRPKAKGELAALRRSGSLIARLSITRVPDARVATGLIRDVAHSILCQECERKNVRPRSSLRGT